MSEKNFGADGNKNSGLSQEKIEQLREYRETAVHLLDDWSDEIPSEFVQGKYKVRNNWFNTIFTLLHAVDQLEIIDPDTIADCYERLKSIEYRKPTTREDIEIGNGVLKEIISKTEEAS